LNVRACRPLDQCCRALSTSNLDPDVVTASGGDDEKRFVGAEIGSGQLVLHGTELVEGLSVIGRKQLSEDTFHRVKRQSARRKLRAARGGDHVRPLTGVEHERIPIRARDGR
jgi:hypothetical protein